MWSLLLCALFFLADSGVSSQRSPNGRPPNWADFNQPPVKARPLFRYWIPDASVEVGPAVQDVAQAKKVGAGGLEALGYYGYETTPGFFVPVDWSTHPWGGESWQALFKSLLEAHRDNGLLMDFALGASMGQGVPAEQDNEGLAWDLTSYNFTVPMGGRFDGKLPGWGSESTPRSGRLMAVVTGLVVSSIYTTDPEPSLPHGATDARTQVTLAADSLTDVTSQVTSDGHLSISFPHGDGLEYVVFVIYEHQFHHAVYQSPLVLGGPQTAPTSFLNNGSWVVDHFSTEGARVTTEFWEKYLLGNGTRELISEVATYAWEDSIEIPNKVYWTRALPRVFQKRRGYSISKWLPILFHQNGLGFKPLPSTWWITDEDDAGNSHIADYRATLGELYGEYLETLSNWSKSLGVEFSAQVGYNLPIDMQRNIPLVDAPECESLGFNNEIDAYRQYAGPASFAGKQIISTELGGNYPSAYQQNFTRLLWEVNRSIVGSVNRFVLHGFPYSGQYPNTTWPSVNTFVYFVSDMHGPHQPGWEFYRPAIDYIARVSHVFQKGVPKKDIAFFSKYTTYPLVSSEYTLDDLDQAGYTYEYLSPDNFDLPSAHVARNVLAPDQQAFKAMVVRADQSMTPDGIKHLAAYARAGLPLIFFGGKPSACLVVNTTCEQYLSQTLSQILPLPNVHLVSKISLAQSLQQLGIQPRTHIQTSGQWYTNWRHNPHDGVDYVFLFNDVQRSSTEAVLTDGSVDFATTGVPYRLDPWTGHHTPILSYTQTQNTTRVSFELAESESLVLAFIPEKPSHGHITQANGPILNISPSDSGDATVLKVRNKAPGVPSLVSLTDSKNEVHSAEVLVEPSLQLQNWTLTVEHWGPPKDLYDMSATVKRNSTYNNLHILRPWKDISVDLFHASGRGFYNTSFSWSPDNKKHQGAYLQLPPISHTVQATLNSHLLPPLNIYHPSIDVTPYLVPGENMLEIVVATPLGNALRPVWKSLVTGGHFYGTATENIAPLPELADYGLVGDVKIVPFVQCRLTKEGAGIDC